MAAWKRRGGMERFEHKLLAGMRERNYSDAFARRILAQIRGFSDYGFPEAHAASWIGHWPAPSTPRSSETKPCATPRPSGCCAIA
jgi:hypothetical protein